MKKFLSYFLIFVMVFVVSTTVTIKVKSELLDSSIVSSTTSANTETGLLSGIMSSIEKDPKMDISGTATGKYSDTEFSVDLNLKVDLTTLTEPNIMGNIKVTLNDEDFDLFVAFVNKTLYLNYGEINIKASIAGITDAINMFKQVIGKAETTETEQESSMLDSINVDSLVGALTNPVKLELGNYNMYQVALDGICNVDFICDDDFAIKGVRVYDVTVLEGLTLEADIQIVQDSLINIEEPTADNLDVAKLLTNVAELLDEDYIKTNIWANVYKDGRFYEYINMDANINTVNNNYFVAGKLRGFVDSDIELNYQNNIAYLKLDDICLSASRQTINNVIDKVSTTSLEVSLPEISVDVQDILNWVKDNYQSLLSSAVVNSSEVKLPINFDGLFGQDKIDLFITLENDQIRNISINGLEYENYSLKLSVYLYLPDYVNVPTVDAEKYYSAENLLDIIDSFVNAEKLAVSGNLSVKYNDVLIAADVDILADVAKKELRVVANIDDEYHVNVTYADDQIYANINDIFIKLSVDYIMNLFGDELTLPQIEDVSNFAKTILKKYSISDLLKLVDVKLNAEQLAISGDLSVLVGKPLTFDVKANINGNVINIENINLNYDNISLAGALSINPSQEEIVTNFDNYLDIEEFIAYVQSYISADSLKIVGNISFENDDILQTFEGIIGADIANKNISIEGELNGFVDGDIKLGYIDEKIYLTYANQSFAISTQSILDILNYFNIDANEYLQKFDDIYQMIRNFDINDMINEKLSNVSIDQMSSVQIDENIIDIVLNIAKNIKINKNQIAVAFDINNVSVDAVVELADSMNVVANVIINDSKVAANVSIAKDAVQYSIDEYIDLDLIASDIINVLDVVSSGAVTGTANIHVSDDIEDIIANYYLQLDLNEKLVNANITFNIYGVDVNVIIENNVIYINAKDVYVSASLDDIKDILSSDFIKGFGISLPDIDMTFDSLELGNVKSLLNKVLEFLNENQVISSLVRNDNKAYITILNKVALVLSTATNSANISANYDEFATNVTINKAEIKELPTLDYDKYVSASDLLKVVENVYNYIIKKQFYMNLDATINNYDVSGYVAYDEDGLTADLSTIVYGKDVSVKISDRVVYVDIDGFKAKISFENALVMLGNINDKFNLNIKPEIFDLLETILAEEKDIETIINKIKDLSDEPIDFKDILTKINVALTLDRIGVDLDDLNANINLENNCLVGANVEYSTENINVVAHVEIASKRPIMLDNEYIDLSAANDLIDDIAEYVNTTSYVGTITAHYKTIELSGNVKFKVEEGKVSAQIDLEFYGLKIEITYVDDVIYFALDDIKIFANKEDIGDIVAWINNTFDKNIEWDDNNLEIVNLEDLLNRFDMSNLILEFVQDGININYNDLALAVVFSDCANVVINYKENLGATIKVKTGEAKIEAPQGYKSYTELTDFVDSVYSVIKDKKIAMTATAKAYEGNVVHYDANCELQLDLNDFKLHVKIVVEDKFKNKTHTAQLNFNNGYWYIYYNELKLKMKEADVNELLAIICKIMDIDASKIDFMDIGDINIDDLNVDSLSAILPKMDLSDPLKLLEYLDDISLVDGSLVANVNGAKVSDGATDQNMKVILKVQNGKLTDILAENLYTGLTKNEHINVDAKLVNFNGVSGQRSGSYIDVSGSNELIKALINTAELNYYEIDGSVSVTGNLKLLFSIPINLSNIPLNVKVKTDENRQPIVYATLGEIPYVPFVTEEKRMVYIYYRDSYIYIRTVSSDQERRIKAHIDSVMDDILYYVQFATGFTDSIMNEIQKSIDEHKGHVPNLGKVLNSYSVVNSKQFNISINMGEVSGDDKIGDMNLSIGVVNNSSTGYKNYLGNASFSIYMPLSSIFDMTISANNLALVNIGKTLDFAATEGYIRDYAYSEGVIATKKSGKWTTESGKTYTITFNSNGGNSISSISGTPGSHINLPTPSKTTVSGGDKTVYEFLGWYVDEALVKEPYTASEMARKNITLYAKWGNPTYYHTISYYIDGTKQKTIQNVSGAALANIATVGGKENREVETSLQRKYQHFIGWVDANGNLVENIGNESINVYAKYEDNLVLNKHTLTLVNGVAGNNTSVQQFNTLSVVSMLPDYSTNLVINNDGVSKTYRFDGWFTNASYENQFDGVMLDSNFTIYAKWTCIKEVHERRLMIYDNETIVCNKLVEVGTTVTLPSSVVVNDSTEWYKDANFATRTTLVTEMPDQDVTLYVRNKYTLTINYYNKEGSTQTLRNTVTVTYYQGQSITLSSFSDEIVDDGNTKKTYSFAGYSQNLAIMPNSDETITGVWNVDVKHYYTITYDLRWYIVFGTTAGCGWKSAPKSIASEKVLEGTVINLNQSKYKVSGTAYTTAIHVGSGKTFTATSWGTSAWGDYTRAGSGFTSYTVTGNQTLYACWEKK